MMPENKMAILMVTANSLKRRPTTPPINKTGINTATKESVIETIVNPISRAPTKAASKGFNPFSMWRTMFSSMTMASSTTKPMHKVKANKDILLIEKFKRDMPP